MKQSTKKTRENEGDDIAGKGRKKRQSTNLHANDEAVLIIRRVSGRDTIPSQKQKRSREDGGGRFGGWAREE